MRALHVISSLDPRTGGPATALVGLARAQRAAGIDVSIVATFVAGTETSAARGLEAEGIEVRLVGPATGPLVSHPELKSAMTEAVGRADVVHVHALWEEAQHQAARAATAVGRP